MIIGCAFVFGLPIAAYIYLFKAETVYKWFGYKQIYLVLCLLVYVLKALFLLFSYALAVSGIIYDIIKEPPFIYCTERGCSMFSNSSQGQFVLEGYWFDEYMNLNGFLSCRLVLLLCGHLSHQNGRYCMYICSFL